MHVSVKGACVGLTCGCFLEPSSSVETKLFLGKHPWTWMLPNPTTIAQLIMPGVERRYTLESPTYESNKAGRLSEFEAPKKNETSKPHPCCPAGTAGKEASKPTLTVDQHGLLAQDM